MKFKAKRCVALLLVVMMLATTFPTNAFAAVLGEKPQSTQVNELAEPQKENILQDDAVAPNDAAINSDEGKTLSNENTEPILNDGTEKDKLSEPPIAIPQEAFTAGWISENGNTYYILADGTKAKGIVEIDGAKYFFDVDGVRRSDFQVVDGKTYFFSNSSFKQLFGWITPGGITYYMDIATGAMATGITEIDGAKYFFDTNGTRHGGFQTVGNETYFFSNSNFKQLLGWITPGGMSYYMEPTTGAMAKGIKVINGEEYVFGNDGVLVGKSQKNVLVEQGGKLYYYDETGAPIKNTYKTVGDSSYYFGANGNALGGFQSINGKTCFFSNSSFKQLFGWITPGGMAYYMKPGTGEMATGITEIDGAKYFFDTNGTRRGGFQTVGNETYFFSNSNFKQLLGWITPGGTSYYMEPTTGAMAKGIKVINGEEYVFGNDGVLIGKSQKNVLVEQGGKLYYYDETGVPIKNTYKTVGDSSYYFGANGNALGGFQSINGKTYFFSNSSFKQLFGWITPGGMAYYMKPGTGEMATGITEIDGAKYFFDTNGTRRSGFQTVGNETYFFSNSNFKQLLGWITPGGTTYYMEPTTGAMTKGIKVINGEEYVFGDDGVLIGKSQKNVLVEQGGKLYYYDGTGAPIRNAYKTVGGSSYYFGANGNALGGFQSINGKTYFFSNSSFKQLFGWITPGGIAYYMKPGTGEMATGITEIDGAKYFFDTNGIRRGGFQTVGDETYFFSNSSFKQLLGWITPGGITYYMEPTTGAMAKGLKTIDGFKYFFGKDGKVQSGFQTIDGKTYFFSAINYKQIFGLISPGGVEYYMDPTSGEMQVNKWITIADRGSCYFTNDGRMAKAPIIQSVNAQYNASDSTYTVSVNASFGVIGAHETAYSFDGGATWGLSSQKVFKASFGGKIASGTIKVRGKLPPNPPAGFKAAEWTVSYDKEISITVPVSKTPYGIDVSMNQGEIDWNKVAQSGVSFAIIRATSYNDEYGGRYVDPYFNTNVRNAKAAGLKVGAYIFSYADSAQRMTDEINHFINSAEMQAFKREGIKFDLPIYVDYEDKFQLNNTTYSQRTDIVRLGMVLLDQSGYYPGFYTYHNYMANFNAAALASEGYSFWYAKYPVDPQPDKNNPSSSLSVNVDIWQYCSDGNVNPNMKPHVNGINGRLDLDYMYSTTLLDRVRAFNGGSITPPPVTTHTLTVYDINTRTVVTAPREEILARIVINEVGTSASAELAKAQAVAAHSWILNNYQVGNSAPGVGLKPLADVSATIKNAVSSVANRVLMFANQPALAMYGASSGGGWTNSALTYWGDASKPYLTNVQTPESVNSGTSTVYYKRYSTTTGRDMGMFLALQKLNITSPDLNTKANWITGVAFDSKGFLSGLTLHGKPIRADEFYENSWGLMSPLFKTVSYNSSMDAWQFGGVSGEGHGLGMSQRGASIYAAQGNGYEWILNHYYPGTNLISI